MQTTYHTKRKEKYFIGELLNRLRKYRSSIEISRIDHRRFVVFKVFSTSDSNGFSVIALSTMNSSIVGPNVFPVKFFSFFISQVKQNLLLFCKVFIDENTFRGRFP